MKISTQIKRFLLASLIFIAFIFVAIFLDALFCLDSDREHMPLIIYYGLGWLASGCYLLCTFKSEEKTSFSVYKTDGEINISFGEVNQNEKEEKK